MNDHLAGLIDGIGMALCLAERNRKNPKRIEPLLATLVRDLVTVSGNDHLGRVNFETKWAREHGPAYPKR
jgi:hypothetical protein